MADDLLDPSRDDLLLAIQNAMRIKGGKPTLAASDVATAMLAAMILENLERSGYVFKKLPPTKGHSTALFQSRSHLKD